MKPTAPVLALLFATLAAIALAEDKPLPPPAPVAPPADTPPSGTAPAPVAPVPFTPLANGKVDDKPADPDVLELPKMVVKQKPRPRLTPEIMVTKKAFGEDLAKQKFSTLDQILNKYTLPLFGTSLAQRALEDHDREKKEALNQDVQNIAKALEASDPEAAKSLKDAAARP